MSKSKKSPKVGIETTEQAVAALKRCHAIDMDFQYWGQSEARAIMKVKEKFDQKRSEGDSAGMTAERNRLVKDLKIYAEKVRKQTGKQTFKLRYGSLVFHAGKPAVSLLTNICKTADAVIARLKRLSDGLYIRTEEKLDKESILRDFAEGAIDGIYLESVGLKVGRKETFTVQTDAEKEMKERLKRMDANLK